MIYNTVCPICLRCGNGRLLLILIMLITYSEKQFMKIITLTKANLNEIVNSHAEASKEKKI